MFEDEEGIKDHKKKAGSDLLNNTRQLPRPLPSQPTRKYILVAQYNDLGSRCELTFDS